MRGEDPFVVAWDPMWRRTFVLVLSLLVVSVDALAQGDRLGAISGTFEACAAALAPLVDRLAAAERDRRSSAEWLMLLRRRLAVEQDRCAQLADAPTTAVLEVIQRYQELGDDLRALELGLQATKARGALPELDVVLGRLLYKLGQQERAVFYLLRAIEVRPTDGDVAQLLGAYYYAKGDVAQAVPFLTIAARGQPDSFGSIAALGDACLAIGDLDCAGEYLARASALRPKDTLLALKVGDFFLASGQPDRALGAYESAVTADPSQVAAWMGLGMTFRRLSLEENAEAAFARAAELSPDDATAAVELSRSQRRNRRPRPSRLGAFAAAPGVAAEVAVEYVLALNAYVRPADAIAYAEAAGLDVRRDPRFIAAVGDAWLSRREPAEALEQYRSARRSAPDEPTFLVRELRALRMLDRAGEAVAVAEKASGVTDPAFLAEHVAALLDHAKGATTQGDVSAAQRSLNRAVDLVPGDSEVIAAAAALAVGRGDLTAAREWLGQLPESAARTSVAAWVAFSARQYAEAARLARDWRLNGGGQAALTLEAAALVNDRQPAEALTLLRLPGPGTRRGESGTWYAKALIDLAALRLGAGEPAQAAALLDGEDLEGFSPVFGQWLRRIPLVAAAARAAPLVGVKWYDELVGGAGERHAVDQLLLAIGDLQASAPEQALKRLRSLPAGRAIDAIRSRAATDAAMRAFERGRFADAAARLRGGGEEAALSVEERFNRAVIRGGRDPRALLAICRAFGAQGVAAALFDQALLLDRTDDNGSAAIEPLTRLLELAPPAGLRGRAEALLGLKRRLY